MRARRKAGGAARAPLEKHIQKAILNALKWRKDVLAWRQNTGVARQQNKDGPQRFIRFGVAGQADITGVVLDGRRLEIEVKRPGQKPTEDQIRFGRRITEMGGIWFVATSVEHCIEQLDAALGKGAR